MTVQPLPVVVACGVSRSDLDAAALALALALPDPVSVRHEIDLAAGTLRRLVADPNGLVEDVLIRLDHTCLSCALREEIVPTLARLAGSGRWGSLLLSLPVASEPMPVVRAMERMEYDGQPVRDLLRVATVAACLTGADVVQELLGDELLEERDPETHADDRRAVGEVLAQQVEYADLVACGDGTLDPLGADLLAELCRPGVPLVADPGGLTAGDLLGAHRDPQARDRHVDPTRRGPLREPAGPAEDVLDVSADPGSTVWTLYLDTWRPFHPARLMTRLEEIGGSGLRGRGCFWLPTRPAAVAVWDGGGGQLSIGTTGTWNGRAPRTRLVVTGLGPHRDDVARALSAALMSEAELARGLTRWTGLDDGFDPWLGDYSEVA